MTEQDAKAILDKVVAQVFGYQNPYTLEQFMTKYAFDVRLPNKVNDTITNEETWAQSTNPTKFITQKNSFSEQIRPGGWEQPKRTINGLQDILAAWNDINYTTTERQLESSNVSQCDNIYNSENVFRSQDVHFSKNVLFSDSVKNAEYLIASQRSFGCVYSIRVEDSKECSESFGISWSGKISKSFMIHDSYDLSDCMFCSHINSKRFCIANMQFEEAEYLKLRDEIIRWLLA